MMKLSLGKICKQNVILFLVVFVFQLTKTLLFGKGNLYEISGDGVMYVGFLENVYLNGVYEYGGSYNLRMPGLLPLYLPLRMMFSQELTLYLASLIKLLLYSFSSIFFAVQVSNYFMKTRVFYFILAVTIGLTDYISTWGYPFVTESLSGSLMMISFGLLLHARKKCNGLSFFLAGLLFTWLVFLRPFMLAIWVFCIVCLAVIAIREKFWRHWVNLMLFGVSCIVVIFIWTMRNYHMTREIVPLQGSWERSEHFKAYRKFLKHIGGDAVEWNPGKEGMWFQSEEYLIAHGFERPKDEIFSQRVFSSNFCLDSLKIIREHFWIANDKKYDVNERELHAQLFVDKIENVLKDLEEKSFFYYHIGSRFHLLFRFVFHPYTYYLALDEPKVFAQILFKVLVYAINSLVIIFGFFLLIWKVVRLFFFKSTFLLDWFLLISVPCFLLFYFPFYLGFIEYRFLVLGFPFLAVLFAEKAEIVLLKNRDGLWRLLNLAKKWFVVSIL